MDLGREEVSGKMTTGLWPDMAEAMAPKEEEKLMIMSEQVLRMSRSVMHWPAPQSLTSITQKSQSYFKVRKI